MILLLVGTQNKKFERILRIVDNAIKKGIVKDEVIAQTGYTKYETENMKCFTFITDDELKEYIDKADLIVTHAGIGSLTKAIEKKKKIFAIPRLAKYKEHINDHQLEIVNKFTKLGYIKKIEDYDDFVREYKNLSKFKPKYPKFDNKKMLDIISNYIN